MVVGLLQRYGGPRLVSLIIGESRVGGWVFW